MNFGFRLSLAALTLVLTTQVANAVEIVRWERLPLAVPLVVGQERIIFVDQNVRVGVPNTIKENLRVQSTGGAIYLKADKAIEPTRLQLQVVNTGEIILVDIMAKDADKNQAVLEPVKIVQGESPSKHYGQTNAELTSEEEETDEAVENNAPVRETPVPVVLTRYAAQNLYAPLRTVEPVDGVSVVNLSRHLDLSTLLPSQPIQAQALAAWRLDDFYVTAIKLRNLSAQLIVLDPRELQGNFATATFQHNTLGNRGTSADTTVVYLVTQGQPLANALFPAISPIDPQGNLEARHEK
ncbi:integrating conjugative element protein [Pseudomonas luteola]|uniref:Integrating conjugative element protein n=1 Tax=Pseudomonas luteola TaxID=47886 RepID=A0A2X2E6Z3_PSELU|nr:TIGR03749 family integrating conjugative element protein [Pseudomonas luteola]SPZ02570.1 integrating conjugative element protein [Pseudomonas luteola]